MLTILHRLTAISVDALEQLMQTSQKDYPELQRLRLYRKDTKRAIGAAGQFKVSLAERVFMTLFFLRHYPVSALLGSLFALPESNAYSDVEMMTGFISKFVPLPERVRQKKRLQEKKGMGKVEGWFARGYEGIERLALGWQIKKPKEKPKGRGLPEEGKVKDRQMSRGRVKVAHKIMAMRRYEVFVGLYRVRGKGYRERVERVGWLENMEAPVKRGLAWRV